MKKNDIEKLINDGLSIRKICKELNVSYGSLRYWLRKYDLRTNGVNSKHNWDEKNVRDAVSKSKCKSDVLRHLGIKIKSGNFQTLDKYLKKYNIDDTNLIYDYSRGNKWNENYTDDEIFCVNSPITQKNLKNRILKKNVIEYKCHSENCNVIDEWNGKKLSLQLDHKNGINNDNRIENLRFLCPNCHSQTETFCNKKVR